MSELRIYGETAVQPVTVLTRFEEIVRALGGIDVLFERWTADRDLDAEATQNEVIEAYRESIDRLMQKYDFQSVDVVRMHPGHPQKDVLRDKFLHEHTPTATSRCVSSWTARACSTSARTAGSTPSCVLAVI